MAPEEQNRPFPALESLIRSPSPPPLSASRTSRHFRYNKATPKQPPPSLPLLHVDLHADPLKQLHFGDEYTTFIKNYNIFHRLMRAIPAAYSSLFNDYISHGCACVLSEEKAKLLGEAIQGLPRTRDRLFEYLKYAREKSEKWQKDITDKLDVVEGLVFEYGVLAEVNMAEMVLLEGQEHRSEMAEDAIMQNDAEVNDSLAAFDPLLRNAHTISEARWNFEMKFHDETREKLNALDRETRLGNQEVKQLEDQIAVSAKALAELLELCVGWERKWAGYLVANEKMLLQSEEEWEVWVKAETARVVRHGEKRSLCEHCGAEKWLGPFEMGWVRRLQESSKYGKAVGDHLLSGEQ